MKKKVIIFGTGGTCLDILNIILDYNSLIRDDYEFLGFLDDDKSKKENIYLGYSVIGTLNDSSQYIIDKNVCFINPIGNSKSFKIREKIYNNLNIPNERYLTIVHPKSAVSIFSEIGFGSVIFPNVTIGVNVKIGNHVIILPNSVINHDSQINDFTLIASNVSVSGNVKIGKNCYIGTGTNIRENINIADRSLIGMGSNVLKDILEEDSVYFGNPAKKDIIT